MLFRSLIAPAGNPTETIRVPMTDESFKQLAIALDLCFNVWKDEKFGPVIRDAMAEARGKTEKAIEAARNGGGQS